jgi:lipopolysaccharide/colanic/teichoic acid biosynthesis glycosyltransferase
MVNKDRWGACQLLMDQKWLTGVNVRIRLPSSRTHLRVRLSPVDVTLAAVSPFVALYLRNVDLVSAGGMVVADSFALVSFAASLIAFRLFRVSSTIPRYISVRDLLTLVKAVVASDLMTAMVLFTITRLDGIPRSVPAIHALILGAGLLASRGLANVVAKHRRRADRPRSDAVMNLILIGLNDWSVLLIKFLQAHAPDRWRVIAVLDEKPQWFGRSINWVQIFGPPAYLEALVEEFAAHGVGTDRVVIAGEARELSAEALAEVQGVCARRNLDLGFAPDLLGLGSAECAGHAARRDPDLVSGSLFLPEIPPAPYHRFKRLFDGVAALILILWLLPLLVIAAVLVFFDVGSPVLFWQQRAGQGGRELQLYKLRTLSASFDRRGQRIPEQQRVSWIGRLLRQTRIDELPQLLNVLVGDMSLIGPRPLLPRDQPPRPTLRLAVRPGITGWAQVNGGVLLSPTEKEALDIWYISNASLWLDLRIIWMTVLILLKGERRSERALADAQRFLAGEARRSERDSPHRVPSRVATGTALPREDRSRASGMGSR